MKSSFGVAPARVEGDVGDVADVQPKDNLDVTCCTRCGESWGYEIVEQVELWSCSQCGYEVRERSADHAAMLDAKQELMTS